MDVSRSAIVEHTRSLDDIRPGTLVTVREGKTPMIVEAIRKTDFGPMAQCCGFPSGNRIWVEDVPLNRLEVHAAPDDLTALSVGTEVRLRPNGPVMTVIGLSNALGIATATCEWDGDNGINRRRSFPAAGLMLSLLQGWD